jgi:hypothetical protein
MNAPPPAPPPHHDDDDETPGDVVSPRRAVGRREADVRLFEEWQREHEARERERERAEREREERHREQRRALVWKLLVPSLSLVGGWLAALGFGYVTPSARLLAVEKAQSEIRAEQAATRRQLNSLLIIRCLDTQTSRDILIAAGVNCAELMRENGLR